MYLSIPDLTLLILFLLRLIKVLFFHLSWWEIKEYRLDRMLVHLKETDQGRRMFFHPLSLIKLTLLIYLLSSGSKLYFPIYTIYIFEAVMILIQGPKKWKIPPPRPRIIAIFISVVFTLMFIPAVTKFSLVLQILLADRLLPFLVVIFILISNLIFFFHKAKTIRKATLKINSYPHLKIIGITGSFGKTTTKEFIYSLLKTKYRVEKTLASQNSDIGVAERVLALNLHNLQYLVVEMAAYKLKEISAITNIFKNKITHGVITGINEQHQSLFGSIDTTLKAKYELIKSIVPEGVAIFNSNNNYCREMASWYSRAGGKALLSTPARVNKLPTEIKASHFKENLGLAILVAQACGMSPSEVSQAVNNLKLPDKTMHEYTVNNNIYIDDTFNANPDGVYAALYYLSASPKRKILVLQPLIELGKYTGAIHNKIGSLSAKICNEVILTNRNFNQPFINGFIKSGGDLQKLHYYPYTLSAQNSIVLFEGKEAGKLLN